MAVLPLAEHYHVALKGGIMLGWGVWNMGQHAAHASKRAAHKKHRTSNKPGAKNKTIPRYGLLNGYATKKGW